MKIGNFFRSTPPQSKPASAAKALALPDKERQVFEAILGNAKDDFCTEAAKTLSNPKRLSDLSAIIRQTEAILSRPS